jgi:pyridinium-3,5-biscarboxylic acid mononucleotide synthase
MEHFDQLSHATLDLSRAERTGIEEVIYGGVKDSLLVVEIARRLLERQNRFLATRLSSAQFSALNDEFGSALRFTSDHRCASVGSAPNATRSTNDSIGIITAGSSDEPIAEEAAFTALYFGFEVNRYCDIGVAGLGRLMLHLDSIRREQMLIVIAGMDGALPSVVAGLVKAPVIAVPTSTGYGTALEGIAPLLTMLSSCSPGISVVNIDNGFGAAVCAVKHLIR